MFCEYPNPPIGSRPIPSAPGYRIIDGGEVWSCRPLNGRGGPVPWHIMRPRKPNRSGHLQIGLRVDGKYWQPYIHQLVLESLIGPCPPGMEGCHNDGNPQNNFVSNLEWGSHEKNAADTARHGSLAGEKNAAAKLTEDSVREVFRLWRDGWTKADIAKMFSVSDVSICNIVNRKTWKRVVV